MEKRRTKKRLRKVNNVLCRIFGVKCDRCGIVLSPHDLGTAVAPTKP
jgi:hypothetical protein